MNLTKQKLMMSAFFTSQFNYYRLVWMCHNRTINNKINHLHERYLRIVYNNNKSLFQELLDKDKSVTIHVKNSVLGPKIWDIVPIELKQSETANSFKREIEKWKPENCPSRLCRPYIQNIHFYKLDLFIKNNFQFFNIFVIFLFA